MPLDRGAGQRWAWSGVGGACREGRGYALEGLLWVTGGRPAHLGFTKKSEIPYWEQEELPQWFIGPTF